MLEVYHYYQRYIPAGPSYHHGAIFKHGGILKGEITGEYFHGFEHRIKAWKFIYKYKHDVFNPDGWFEPAMERVFDETRIMTLEEFEWFRHVLECEEARKKRRRNRK